MASSFPMFSPQGLGCSQRRIIVKMAKVLTLLRCKPMKKFKMISFPLTLTLGLASVLTFSMTGSALAQGNCQAGMSLSFDLSKTNNPSIKNNNTYIVILGINPATKKHAYVKFEQGNTLGTLIDVTNEAIN